MKPAKLQRSKNTQEWVPRGDECGIYLLLRSTHREVRKVFHDCMPTPDSDRPERGGRGSIDNSVGTSDRLFIPEDAGEVEVVLLVSLSQPNTSRS